MAGNAFKNDNGTGKRNSLSKAVIASLQPHFNINFFEKRVAAYALPRHAEYFITLKIKYDER